MLGRMSNIIIKYFIKINFDVKSADLMWHFVVSNGGLWGNVVTLYAVKVSGLMPQKPHWYLFDLKTVAH